MSTLEIYTTAKSINTFHVTNEGTQCNEMPILKLGMC